MAFHNVGVYVNGVRPKSKKALKDAIRDTPGEVRFDSTSAFADTREVPRSPAHIGPNDKMSVVGPDPYTKRAWYAIVEQSAKGLKVS